VMEFVKKPVPAGPIKLPSDAVMAWSRDSNVYIATRFDIFQVIPKLGSENGVDDMEVDDDDYERKNLDNSIVTHKAKLAKFSSEAVEMSLGRTKLFLVSRDDGRLVLSWVCLETWRFRHGDTLAEVDAKKDAANCWITVVHQENLGDNFQQLFCRTFPSSCEELVLVRHGESLFCFPVSSGNSVEPIVTISCGQDFDRKCDFQRRYLRPKMEKEERVHFTNFSSLISILKMEKETAQKFDQKFFCSDIKQQEFCGASIFLLTSKGELWRYSKTSSEHGFKRNLVMGHVKNFTNFDETITVITDTNDVFCGRLKSKETKKTSELKLKQPPNKEILQNIFESTKIIKKINEEKIVQQQLLDQLKLATVSVQNSAHILQSSLGVRTCRGRNEPDLVLHLANKTSTTILGKFWCFQLSFPNINFSQIHHLPDSFPPNSTIQILSSIPSCDVASFPLQVNGCLVFNTQTLADYTMIKSVPLINHTVTLLQCLLVKQVGQHGSSLVEKLVLGTSNRTVGRDSFLEFLNQRCQPTESVKIKSNEKSAECFISPDVLADHSGDIEVFAKLLEYTEKHVVVAAFGGSMISLEYVGEEEKLKIASENEKLVNCVIKDVKKLLIKT